MRRVFLIASSTALAVPASAAAADLPGHDPISIVIVGDAVNPHGLPPESVTDPADLEAALGNPASGLQVASIEAVDSSCVDAAISSLSEGSADVLVYFAHQSARGCGGQDRQADLTSAIETFLVEGGGVVVFHHGIFVDPAKGPLLQLLGARADAIEWNTSDGQNVISVAPDHFVAQNGVAYAGMVAFSAPSWGVTQADYPVFNNTPDERYPGLTYLTEPDESRTTLFASDYGGGQILGYDLHRPSWRGHVVLYQPGEYQPNAVDDFEGNNFQILANALVYAATTVEEPMDPGETDGGTGTDGSSGGNDDSGATTSTDGSSSAETGATATSGEATTGGTDTASADGTVPSRCRVSPTPRGAGWFATLLMLVGLGRRRAKKPR